MDALRLRLTSSSGIVHRQLHFNPLKGEKGKIEESHGCWTDEYTIKSWYHISGRDKHQLAYVCGSAPFRKSSKGQIWLYQNTEAGIFLDFMSKWSARQNLSLSLSSPNHIFPIPTLSHTSSALCFLHLKMLDLIQMNSNPLWIVMILCPRVGDGIYKPEIEWLRFQLQGSVLFLLFSFLLNPRPQYSFFTPLIILMYYTVLYICHVPFVLSIDLPSYEQSRVATTW